MTRITKTLVSGGAAAALAFGLTFAAAAEGMNPFTKQVFHINERGKVEVQRGEVTSVDAFAGNFRVRIWTMEWTVLTNGETRILARDGRTITLADMRTGDRVKVKGDVKIGALMTMTARQVVDGSALQFKREAKGTIVSTDLLARTFVLELRSGHRLTVAVTDSTRIEDEEGDDFGLSTFADLNVGDKVEVKGAFDERTNILTATKVELEEEPED